MFYYFGDDEAYFRVLQTEFKNRTNLSPELQRHTGSSEEKIQSLFLLIIKNNPACVFIDFSQNTQDFLHLARLISRTELDPKPKTVGLVDYLSPREVIDESIATGIDLTHIKSAETFDVVYDTAFLLAPDSAQAHGFATADMAETWEAGVVAKIGYVTSVGLHLETNFQLEKGDRFRLDHAWSKDKVIPSKEVFVTNTSTKNLFYHFNTGVDLEFVVIDEFIPPEGMEESTVREKKAERTDLIKKHKKKMGAWVEDNLSRSQEKSTKFLILDKQFRFYNGLKRTDKYPYIIRCASHLKDIADDLSRLCPQIIAVSLEALDVQAATLNFDFLEKLVAVLKRDHAEATPFLVVFNTEIATMDLRQQLSYEHLMATGGELEAPVLIKMADILDKKITAKKPSSKERAVYLKKTNPSSHALIQIHVNVIKMSESDIIFTWEKDLKAGTNLHFSKPVPFYVNVQPIKGQGKKPEYKGLIHCIGESDKKELRRYVNSLFFRDHDALLTAETDEYKKLHESKLQQKLDAIRVEQEKALAIEEANKAKNEMAQQKQDEAVTEEQAPEEPKKSEA